jgi:hypothetical protein
VLLAGGLGLATARGAQAATGCSVGYTVSSQWSGGFTASVAVTNLGSPVTQWTVTWAFTAGQHVDAGWNATVTQSGAQVTAASMAYNGALATNGTVSFGFQGTWTGSNPAPPDFAVNGVSCSGGSQPTTVAPSTAPPSTGTPSPSGACPASGHVTYTLARESNPTAEQANAYALITTAMDQAVGFYNCYTDITKALNVSYNPSVATADGNINGSIRFGATSTMQRITAMHEIAHTVGVGTYWAWSSMLSGGIWTGPAATAQLRAIDGDPTAQLHGDSQHFWPYGLNYTSEVSSDADLVAHCRIVAAMRQDMGMS